MRKGAQREGANVVFQLILSVTLRSMRAFVTGTTGLLGSNLTRALLQSGYEVKGFGPLQGKGRSRLQGHAGGGIRHRRHEQHLRFRSRSSRLRRVRSTLRLTSANTISRGIAKARSKRSTCKAPSTCSSQPRSMESLAPSTPVPPVSSEEKRTAPPATNPPCPTSTPVPIFTSPAKCPPN